MKYNVVYLKKIGVMKMHNFYKIGAASPKIKLTDCKHNAKEICDLILKAEQLKLQAIIFPQLSLTGATCLDLFKQSDLIEDAKKNLDEILKNLSQTQILYVIGLPMKIENQLFNCAAICQGKNILGIVSKTNLSDTDQRYFSAIQKNFTTQINNIAFGDLTFIIDDKFTMKINFDNDFSPDADLNLNLCAKPIQLDNDCDEAIIKSECIKNNSACVFINAGYGESTTDFVYSGNGFIFEKEKKLAHTKKYEMTSQIIYSDIDIDAIVCCDKEKNFGQKIKIDLPDLNEVTRKFSPNPFLEGLDKTKALEEILLIQQRAIITRFQKSHSQKIIIGVSGGVDSTLTLLNAVFVCDNLKISRENILAITMPGFGTSTKTFESTQTLLKNLGVTPKTISIKESCIKHFEDIGHDIKIANITFENAQARERTQILFDLANKFNGIVLGTGDMSEEALGFTTYNGDHISNYNPNTNLPKTIVRELINFVADKNYFPDEINSCLKNILETPISPELLPVNENREIIQHTENIVGPYELNDFFVYYVLKYGYPKQKIIYMAQKTFEKYSHEQIENYFDGFYKRFIRQQFKRSCATDGPQIFSFGFSPRNSFLMPSDV
jgi:NAD+ synthetase